MNPEAVNGTSQPTRPMSRVQRAKVFKYPCDGVKRFGVKGQAPFAEGQTYSDAYDMIFFATGGRMDDKGGRSFSKEGVRRITELNSRYIGLAAKFIQEWFAEERKKAAEAAVQGVQPAIQPKPEEPK